MQDNTFIQVEKAWNSPEMIMQRALKIANNTINQLEAKIERDKPKIVFADAVATTKTSILVGELAKIIKQNGINIGNADCLSGYVKTDSLLNTRVWIIHVTQYSMERGYSKLKKHQSHIRTVTHQLVRRQK
ncbi:phage antirepressor KilAC domain-containing protein [Staphylococcus aureus]